MVVTISIRQALINRILDWEWHYIRQRRTGDYSSAHQLKRCQLIIERMECLGWLP